MICKCLDLVGVFRADKQIGYLPDIEGGHCSLLVQEWIRSRATEGWIIWCRSLASPQAHPFIIPIIIPTASYAAAFQRRTHDEIDNAVIVR